MSLELALKETTAAIHQLITTLQSNKTLPTAAPPPLKIVGSTHVKAKGPYYWKSLDGLKMGVVEDSDALQAIIDANPGVEITQKKEDRPCQEKRAKAVPDLESLDIRLITALANLFGAEAKNLTTEHVEKAHAYEKGNKRDPFTDALSLALLDSTLVKHAPRAVLLDLCITMLAHWSAMSTLEERRAFAEAYIKTPYHQRDGLIPQQAAPTVTPEPKTTEPELDTTALFAQAQELILKLCTHGQRHEAVAILNRFGAAKLGEVPPENLADVVRLAEALLPVLAEE